MFERIESWLTLGNRYVVATVVYFGLALILSGSTLLDHPQTLAASNSGCTHTDYEYQEGQWVPVTKDGCPDGQQCCGGGCVSSDLLCCEDGTSGNADTCMCLCCENCDANSVTTIICEGNE